MIVVEYEQFLHATDVVRGKEDGKTVWLYRKDGEWFWTARRPH